MWRPGTRPPEACPVHGSGLDGYLAVMRESGLRDVRIVEERPYASPGTPPDLVGRITSILVSASK
jgi:hypothetical protein